MAALLLLPPFLLFLGFCHPAHAFVEVINLTAPEFYGMAQKEEFNAIVDVRRPDEWAAGHIENATFVESLQLANTSEEITSAVDLEGCRNCPIVIYCRTGRRSYIAIQKLITAGFTGPLYNGLGVTQWTAEGYPLVNTSSVNPKCKNPVEQTCAKAAEQVGIDKETATNGDGSSDTSSTTEANGSETDQEDVASSATAMNQLVACLVFWTAFIVSISVAF